MERIFQPITLAQVSIEHFDNTPFVQSTTNLRRDVSWYLLVALGLLCVVMLGLALMNVRKLKKSTDQNLRQSYKLQAQLFGICGALTFLILVIGILALSS